MNISIRQKQRLIGALEDQIANDHTRLFAHLWASRQALHITQEEYEQQLATLSRIPRVVYWNNEWRIGTILPLEPCLRQDCPVQFLSPSRYKLYRTLVKSKSSAYRQSDSLTRRAYYDPQIGIPFVLALTYAVDTLQATEDSVLSDERKDEFRQAVRRLVKQADIQPLQDAIQHMEQESEQHAFVHSLGELELSWHRVRNMLVHALAGHGDIDLTPT